MCQINKNSKKTAVLVGFTHKNRSFLEILILKISLTRIVRKIDYFRFYSHLPTV